MTIPEEIIERAYNGTATKEDALFQKEDELQKVNSKLYSSMYLIKKYGGTIEETPRNMNEQMNFRITIPRSN